MNNDSFESRYRELIDVIGEINSVIRVGRFHFLDCFGFLALEVKRLMILKRSKFGNDARAAGRG